MFGANRRPVTQPEKGGPATQTKLSRRELAPHADSILLQNGVKLRGATHPFRFIHEMRIFEQPRWLA